MSQPDNCLMVNLEELWQAGRVLLPHLAEVYEDDNQDIHNTAFYEAEAFTWSDGTSPCLGPWQMLRDTVQNLFADTADGLVSVGQALILATDHYTATDEASAELTNRINAYLTSPLDLLQPPDGLQLERPGDGFEIGITADGSEVPLRDASN